MCARWWLPSAHRAHKVSTNPPIFICIMYVSTCILLHLRRHICLAQCAFYYTYLQSESLCYIGHLRIQLEGRCVNIGRQRRPCEGMRKGLRFVLTHAGGGGRGKAQGRGRGQAQGTRRSPAPHPFLPALCNMIYVRLHIYNPLLITRHG